jgi:hypothetical protein
MIEMHRKVTEIQEQGAREKEKKKQKRKKSKGQ